MTGDFVKKKIEKADFQLNAIAKKLHVSPQNFHSKLNVQDIRVGFLLEIAKAINKPLDYFFEDYEEFKRTKLPIDINKEKEFEYLRKECYEKGNRIIKLLDENAALRKELEEYKRRDII